MSNDLAAAVRILAAVVWLTGCTNITVIGADNEIYHDQIIRGGDHGVQKEGQGPDRQKKGPVKTSPKSTIHKDENP